MRHRTFAEHLKTEVAALQATYPNREGEIARACALIANGQVIPMGAGEAMVLSSSDPDTLYTVNSHCTCSAGSHGKSCKHVSAWKLYQHVQKQFAAQVSKMPDVEPKPEPKPETVDPKIPAQFVQMIQNKPFVKYVGVLAMAHEAGLVKLEARFVSVTAELAVAEATATFADGRIFTEAGDASPGNVSKGMAPHFARCALTRAKARALKDAMNLAMCAVEEIE